MKKILGFMLMLVVWVHPVIAQEELPMLSYSSVGGAFSFAHPANWVIEESRGFPGVRLANSEEALNLLLDRQASVQEGDFALTLMLLPESFLSFFPNADINGDWAALTQAIAQGFLTGDQDSLRLGEVTVTTVNEDQEVGLVSIQNVRTGGVIYVFPTQQRVVGIAVSLTQTGQAQFYDELVLALIESFSLNVDSVRLLDLWQQ